MTGSSRCEITCFLFMQVSRRRQSSCRISRGGRGELHIVPLSRQAVAVLSEIKALSGDRNYVFPNEHNRQTYMSENTMLYALWQLSAAHPVAERRKGNFRRIILWLCSSSTLSQSATSKVFPSSVGIRRTSLFFQHGGWEFCRLRFFCNRIYLI